jgi:hypothetical protein
MVIGFIPKQGCASFAENEEGLLLFYDYISGTLFPCLLGGVWKSKYAVV